MAKLSAVDWEKADLAANRICLGYSLADELAAYTGDDSEQYAAAVTVASLVVSFALLEMGLKESQAIAELTRGFRIARRIRNRIGKDCTLRDVLTEIHLEKGQ